MSSMDTLLALKRSRSAKFWRSIGPYLRLAGGSLPGLVFLGLIGLWMYNRLIDGLPDSFPAILACSLVLAYSIGSVWVRTFLEPADLIYLLPFESRMRGYFRSCFKSGIRLQTAKVAAFWLLLWPLYSLSAISEQKSFYIVLAILIGIKWLGIYFWWIEIHIRNRSVQGAYSIIRLLLVFGFVYITLSIETAMAILFIGISSIAFVLLLRIPSTLGVAWERLIRLERRRISQWRTVLSQFAELSNERPDVRANLLARLARIIPFRKSNAYRYLYFLIWCRSPIFGLTVRLTAVGSLLCLTADNVWLKSGLGLLFAIGLRLQLLELIRYRLPDDNGFVFPIDEALKAASARFIAGLIWAGTVVVIFMPLAIRGY